MTYDQVIRTLFSPEIEKYIPDGVGHSIPIMTKNNGKIIDNFFIYSKSLDGRFCNVPFATIGIYAEEGKLVYYKKLQDSKLFVNYCTDNGIIKLSNSICAESKKMIWSEFKGRYEPLRNFVYVDTLTNDQKKTLSRFRSLLTMIIDEKMLPIYTALFPDFFKWLDSYTDK